MAASKFTIEITKFPEALWAMRKELAGLLRSEADAEADPRIARRLREIAATFEAGA
jgi:hypothetical protein